MAEKNDHATVRSETRFEDGPAQPGSIVIGDWYWLRLDEEDDEEEEEEEEDDEEDGPDLSETETDEEDLGTWKSEHEEGLVRRTNGERRFVCVTGLGSNYANVQDVWGQAWRVHFGHFVRVCEHEPNPDAVIGSHVEASRRKIQEALRDVQEIHVRLGLSQIRAAQAAEQTGLAILSGHADPKAHGDALAKARDEDLPALYKVMKDENKQMVQWLSASTIPFRALSSDLHETVQEIDSKIFNIELYAGLVERVDLIKDGDPAPLGTKLHLMQRRHYMDEECLLDYEAGGMDFKRIRDFDRWLSKPVNLERIFPHPRCIVAFQVRRRAVERGRGKHTLHDFIRFMQEDEANKLTFLYIRNGERLFCLETQIDFKEKLFPDLEHTKAVGSGAMYMSVRTNEVISESRYDSLVAEFRLNEKKYKQEHDKWVADAGAWDLFWGPQLDKCRDERKKIQEKYQQEVLAYEATLDEDDLKWFKSFGHAKTRNDHPKRPSCPKDPDHPQRPHEPWNKPTHPSSEWVPFNTSSVKYDDAVKKIESEIQDHNRVALIIQGLFDRTDVLHPHGPVRLWDVEGFDQAVELVYDTDRALTTGEKPDIQAYLEGLRASIVPGSYTMGQEPFWLRQMAEKENERRASRSRDYLEELESFRPYGNPGPGLVARVVSMRGGKCRYEWQRERTFSSYRRASIIIDEDISCPTKTLFHVSAYAPGDYKQFFADPRTRQDYLEWAPLLLRAEDWHAEHGKSPPVPVGSERKPMSLTQLVDREFGDPIFVRRTHALKTKVGKPRKRGPSTKIEEGIENFSRCSTSGRAANRKGYIYVDIYEVTLIDGTKLRIKREDTFEGQNVWAQGDVTYEFFWPNRAENEAHKKTRRRRNISR